MLFYAAVAFLVAHYFRLKNRLIRKKQRIKPKILFH